MTNFSIITNRGDKLKVKVFIVTDKKNWLLSNHLNTIDRLI